MNDNPSKISDDLAKAFVNMQLVTGPTRGHVQYVTIPRYKTYPDILIWGERYFGNSSEYMTSDRFGNLRPRYYIEQMAVPVVPVAGVTENGLG